MATAWRNDGEPVNGFYEAVVDLEDGSQPQVFRGRSEREVADKLLEAQTHASRRINQLRAEAKPDAPRSAAPQPQPLTAGERMQLAHDITDPAKSDEALERLMASKGIPVGEVKQIIEDRHLELERAAAVAETQKFVEATPDWYPSDHNKTTLANYMRAQNMGFTARNFSLAFEALAGAGLLQAKPSEESPEPQPAPSTEPDNEQRIVASTTRPRTTMSTGMRAAEGRTAPPPQSRPKYTKRDIERMPQSEYRHRLDSEPGFSQAVELAYSSR